jgi:hypothetical protein
VRDIPDVAADFASEAFASLGFASFASGAAWATADGRAGEKLVRSKRKRRNFD